MWPTPSDQYAQQAYEQSWTALKQRGWLTRCLRAVLASWCSRYCLARNSRTVCTNSWGFSSPGECPQRSMTCRVAFARACW